MENKVKQLSPGFYSLIYASGEYRTIRIKREKNGPLTGRVIISLKEFGEFNGCGFLQPDNSVYFWKRFKQTNSEIRMQRIRRAIATILQTPRACQSAFAMREGRCARCGRKLTVPASLANSFGPECAGRGRWNKEDNRLAFEAQREMQI